MSRSLTGNYETDYGSVHIVVFIGINLLGGNGAKVIPDFYLAGRS